VNPDRGVFDVAVRSLVTATGCREKTDRQIFLHGERPAGVFTAGQAQDYINLRGYLPGRKCVVLGSGDIGLIMARRLTLEGVEVTRVYEIGEEPSGLTRNIAQCLEDYGIPLHLGTGWKV
jgi:NADPH-dependent 2,4-dienoyl-CoA reductase/sulfur reductase-like enzyme